MNASGIGVFGNVYFSLFRSQSVGARCLGYRCVYLDSRLPVEGCVDFLRSFLDVVLLWINLCLFCCCCCCAAPYSFRTIGDRMFGTVVLNDAFINGSPHETKVIGSRWGIVLCGPVIVVMFVVLFLFAYRIYLLI